MNRVHRKYALDTHLFIDGLRREKEKEELKDFHAVFAPFEYLSAVVAMELRAGATPREGELLRARLFEPFERRGRIVVPSYKTWNRAGAVLARLAEKEHVDTVIASSFARDVLLALSCKEAGITVVTSNARDFERIARVTPIDFVAPWPRPG